MRGEIEKEEAHCHDIVQEEWNDTAGGDGDGDVEGSNAGLRCG